MSDPSRTDGTSKGRLPGDAAGQDLIDRIIRVDHAGEYGAVRIYAGQLAVLKNDPNAAAEIKRKIEHMGEQEVEHLRTFERLMVERHARPTLLQPIWHVAGFALGAATALLGPNAAMACTEAVEEVIDEHYAAQSKVLGDSEPALKGHIEKFRADEIEHRDIARANGAAEAPAYPLLTNAIKQASRVAIWLSERI